MIGKSTASRKGGVYCFENFKKAYGMRTGWGGSIACYGNGIFCLRLRIGRRLFNIAQYDRGYLGISMNLGYLLKRHGLIALSNLFVSIVSIQSDHREQSLHIRRATLHE